MKSNPMRATHVFCHTLLLSAVLTLGACATAEKAGEPGGANAMLEKGGGTQDPYLKVIEQFSEGDSDYQTFYNQFAYKATLVNSPVREATLLKEADYFKWDPQQLATERAKAEKKMETTTEIFMSFFTPERRNDNLTDIKSIWRVYLDVDGKRYQGRAKKAKKLFPELNALFPYHTRWNTPYVLEFDLPTQTPQNAGAKLTVTGPLGTREIDFVSAQ
ncbi:MAG: hypothetical protein NDI61_12995 [Bdellovibrionaceae bacterium]|nr:hypothetical protein [Pseudobdellovibrionaceae bacterium]